MKMIPLPQLRRPPETLEMEQLVDTPPPTPPLSQSTTQIQDIEGHLLEPEQSAPYWHYRQAAQSLMLNDNKTGEPPKAPCRYTGLALATLSSFFFSLCSVIVKGMIQVHPMELAVFRFMGVLLPSVPIVIRNNVEFFPKGHRIILLLRSFFGSTGLMLSFYAFRHMPLADASVVVFSVPVFVSLFARLFLQEPCGPIHILSVALTLAGVVLITRPPLAPVDAWAASAALGSTLFGANAYVLLRALNDVHYSVVMLNYGSFALVQTLLICWLLGALCLPRCGWDRFLVLSLALMSWGGQYLLTRALQVEQAGPVSVARSVDIVFAFLWQVLFFNESPNRYSLCGAALVTFSVVLTGLRKWALSLPDTSLLRRYLTY